MSDKDEKQTTPDTAVATDADETIADQEENPRVPDGLEAKEVDAVIAKENVVEEITATEDAIVEAVEAEGKATGEQEAAKSDVDDEGDEEAKVDAVLAKENVVEEITATEAAIGEAAEAESKAAGEEEAGEGDVDDEEDEGFKARRKNRPNRYQDGADIESDDFDDEDVQQEHRQEADALYARCEAAAKAAGLDPGRMIAYEKQALPMFVPPQRQIVFLECRNRVLELWYRDVNTYLARETAANKTKDLPLTNGVFDVVFDFLEQFGYINNALVLKPPEVAAAHAAKKIVVIGAGISGLIASRQLSSFGHEVVVLEGRDRLGGRINTAQGQFSGPVDLGASIINGLGRNPIGTLFHQVATEKEEEKLEFGSELPGILHYLRGESQGACPIYQEDGTILEADEDEDLERVWNRILEGTKHIVWRSTGKDQDLGTAEEEADKRAWEEIDLPSLDDRSLQKETLGQARQRVIKALNLKPSADEAQVLDWHEANLEYGCAAELQELSLLHWDQDDPYGYDGEHGMLKDGYSSLVNKLAEGLDIRLNQAVCEVQRPSSSGGKCRVVVKQLKAGEDGTEASEEDGNEVREVFEADAVLVTVSLGVLKSKMINFEPPLPSWKQEAVQRLGFGLINKLVLEFETAFWLDRDMWGYAGNQHEDRGRFYMFWNIHRVMGKPILTALAVGGAAHRFEEEDEAGAVKDCMVVLRKMFGEDAPDPIQTTCTKWKDDKFARGTYSYVAAGSSAMDYDALARNVGDSLFFAGEATNRYNPATVPGAYWTGLRASAQILRSGLSWPAIFSGSEESTSVEDSMEADPTMSSLMMKLRTAFSKKRGMGRRGITTAETEEEEPEESAEPQEDPVARRLRVENTRRAMDSTIETLITGGDVDPLANIIDADMKFVVVQPTIIGGNTHKIIEEDFMAKEREDDGLDQIASFGASSGSSPSQKKQKKDSKPSRSSKHKKRKNAPMTITAKENDDQSGSHHSRKRSKSGMESNKKEPRKLIKDYVHKAIHITLTNVDTEVKIAIGQKVLKKVLEDWASKDRSKVKVPQWLSEKRKESIKGLISKYISKPSSKSRKIDVSSSDEPPPLPTTRPMNVGDDDDVAAPPPLPPVSAAPVLPTTDGPPPIPAR